MCYYRVIVVVVAVPDRHSRHSPIERAAGGEMHSVAAVRNQNVNNGLSTRREDTKQIN